MSPRDARSGTSFSDFALVLDRVLYKESDAIFTLLTHEHGKLSAIARGAARSIKRFGAAVEPGNVVLAQLKTPREQGDSQAPIWQFESADLKARYDHFRRTYDAIESLSFVLRLVKDVFPDGPIEPAVFKTVGRFLRDSESLDFPRNGRWFRLSFWSWVGYQMGLGNVDGELREKILGESNNEFLRLWAEVVENSEADPKPLFAYLSAPNFAIRPKANDETRFYQNWLERSGLTWKHFEKWQNSQHI